MLSLIDNAKGRGADLVVFPELSLCGPLYDDMVSDPYLLEECRAAAMEIASFAQGIQVIFGSVGVDEQGRAVSRAYYAAEGILKPLDAAATTGAVCETPYYQESEGRISEIMLDGAKVRLLVILGEQTSEQLPKESRDADLVINLTPQNITFDGSYQTQTAFGKPYIQVGSVGLLSRGKANYLLAGDSSYYAADGRKIAGAALFKEDLVVWRQSGGEIPQQPTGDELLVEALIQGTREFCLSIHARRAVIGISGGIDSALAACIYREALGADNVYLISMPTIYNSEKTKTLAQGMASGLGLNFASIALEQSLQQFYQSLEANPFVDSTGKVTDIALSSTHKENVMARERARILAAAAAAMDGIFTCNGNKAEMSVGYATFYGDLAGAFAAQADLWKYQVYAACANFQQRFPHAPLAETAAIRPSAELSPAQDVNQGLGDPLIYAYHDYLLKSWVEAGKTPTDTLHSYLKGSLAADIGCGQNVIDELFADATAFIADIERWWKMYRGIGIAKRVQSPPLLALSRHPFGDLRREQQGAVFFDCEFRRLKEELTTNGRTNGK